MKGRGMRIVNIYEERIFSKRAFLIGSIAALALALAVYLALSGEVVIGLVINIFPFLLFLMLTICFSQLIIKITPHEISFGHRIFNQSIPIEDIEGYSLLRSPPPLMTGGFSTRWGEYEGKKYIAYDVWGTPRIILHLKKERKNVAFSTKKPDEIAGILDEYLSQK